MSSRAQRSRATPRATSATFSKDVLPPQTCFEERVLYTVLPRDLSWRKQLIILTVADNFGGKHFLIGRNDIKEHSLPGLQQR